MTLNRWLNGLKEESMSPSYIYIIYIRKMLNNLKEIWFLFFFHLIMFDFITPNGFSNAS